LVGIFDVFLVIFAPVDFIRIFIRVIGVFFLILFCILFPICYQVVIRVWLRIYLLVFKLFSLNSSVNLLVLASNSVFDSICDFLLGDHFKRRWFRVLRKVRSL
jgi:hypothetical protein